AAEANRLQLADMLGLEEADVADGAAWIDTGSDQLIVQLTSVAAVAGCEPDPELLSRWGRGGPDRCLVYVWAQGEGDEVQARFFFNKGSAIAEDPATGSACANLGGWFVL